MKTLIAYTAGSLIGIIAALFLPLSSILSRVIGDISSYILGAGSYFFLPLIFFSLPVAITRLRRLGKLRPLLAHSSLYIVVSSAILALSGTIIALAIDIGRIPVVSVQPSQVVLPQLGNTIRSILSFEGLWKPVNEGLPLLTILLPACLLGWHFFHNKEIAEPSYNVFDSLSRIFYRANRYLLKFMPFFLAVLAFQSIYSARRIAGFQKFVPLVTVLLGTSAFLIIIVYPLLLRIIVKYNSPWKTLAQLSGPIIGALFSASPLFNYGNTAYHLKEKIRIPRQSSALILPGCLMFARGGTALFGAVCMMTIIRSYSSLEITLFQAAWTALFSFLVSFVLPTVPVHGLTAMLVIIGKLYARGVENGWYILMPIIPLLVMICTMLDTATGILILIIANKRAGLEVIEDY